MLNVILTLISIIEIKIHNIIVSINVNTAIFGFAKDYQ